MKLPAPLSTDRLTIYMNDHLAGSAFGRDLARRILRENRGNEFEPKLEQLATAIEEDQDELEDLIDRLDLPVDRLKLAGGWVVEKVGRFKPNGQLRGYSPLSRLVELEGLAGGVQAKLALWRALREIAAREPLLDAERLDQLVARAESQLDDLVGLQARAAKLALGGRRARP
jgi:hypothetical protein